MSVDGIVVQSHIAFGANTKEKKIERLFEGCNATGLEHIHHLEDIVVQIFIILEVAGNETICLVPSRHDTNHLGNIISNVTIDVDVG